MGSHSEIACVYRNYDKAIKAVLAMRNAAEERGHDQKFNTFLMDIAGRYEHDRQHSSFWQSIVKERILLLGNAEEADNFFKQHSGVQVLNRLLCMKLCAQLSCACRQHTNALPRHVVFSVVRLWQCMTRRLRKLLSQLRSTQTRRMNLRGWTEAMMWFWHMANIVSESRHSSKKQAHSLYL